MPTSKKRINISLPNDVHILLQELSARDDVPQATKALELLKMAMDIEEDAYLSELGEERLKKTKKYISHKKFWS
jgi:predicted DNA-binding protein